MFKITKGAPNVVFQLISDIVVKKAAESQVPHGSWFLAGLSDCYASCSLTFASLLFHRRLLLTRCLPWAGAASAAWRWRGRTRPCQVQA